MTKEEQQKDDIETMKILFNADINELCNQRRFNDAREMEGIRDRIIKALEQQPSEDCVKREDVKSGMIKYGFLAPDMTVTEFVEDCLPPVTPTNEDIKETYLKGYDYGVKDWFKSKTQPTHGSTYGGVSWGGIYKEEAQPTNAVSREAVEEITFQEPSYTDPYNILTEVREKVRALPPVTPERPKGKWIEYEVDVAPHPLHCSLCGFSNHHISNRYMREFRRCPNCGAEMEVEE